MKRVKRILTLILALSMLVCLVPAEQALAAQNAVCISPERMTLTVGQKKTIKYTVGGTVCKADGWKSSNTSVATVNKSGVVTAKKKGSATISCDTGYGFSLKCQVTVTGGSKAKKSKKKSTKIKAFDFSKYINSNYTKLVKKVPTAVHLNKAQDPAAIGNIYEIQNKEGLLYFRYDQATKKITEFQNSNQKKVSLYGVKLGMKASKAKSILKKKNCKLTQEKSISGKRKIIEYTKSGHKVTVRTTKGKVTCLQWSR